MLSIDFEKYTLSNGLTVILHRDDSLPMVAVNLWYHVGSKDEEPGRTGFAHLFEHIMFEGSKNHNLDFFAPLEKVGANINGSTTNDRTNYWTTAPSNNLELILWLESDRMGFLLEALDQERLDLQRDVVKNERRQSYENRPYGKASLAMDAAAFPSPHPYSWPVIGSQEDLNAAALEDVQNFFKTYYAPTNASVAIAGDFDPDETKRLIETYFGDIPPGPAVDRVGQMNSGLTGEVRMDMRDKVQLPRLSIVWPTGPMFGPDEAPLDILASIMGEGKSSRLHKTLVYEKQIARDVMVGHYTREIAGEFIVQVTGNPGQSLDEIEEIVHAEFDRIRSEPPTQREVGRALNRFESSNVRSLERIGGFGGRADQLNLFNAFTGDPGRINTDIERYRTITAEDVVRLANGALGEDRVRMTVLPEEQVTVGASADIDRAVTPISKPARSFSPPIPQREKLANGLNVLYVEDFGLPVISTSLVFQKKSVGDPLDRPGLSSLTAGMLSEGTSSMSSQEIAEEMEFMGASIHSSASYEQATIWTSALTQHWDRAMEILADVTRNANFQENELERIRKERLTDLQRISDDASAIAQRASRALLYGRGTAYGNPMAGTVDSVTAITRDELVTHFRRSYGPADATLIVVGDTTKDKILDTANKHFGDWTTSNPSPRTSSPTPDTLHPTPTRIFLADKPGVAQSVIKAGHLTIDRHDSDYYALNLLNYLFGAHFMARLNQNLRQDKGYSYGFHSAVDWSTGPSTLSAWGSVQTEVTKESVIEVLKEFKDIHVDRLPDEEEFNDARNGLLKGFPGQFETQGQMLSQFARNVMFGLADDYYSGLVAHYEALTLDDLHRVATDRVDNDHLSLLVVGDRSVIEPGLEEIGVPIVHVDYEGAVID